MKRYRVLDAHDVTVALGAVVGAIQPELAPLLAVIGAGIVIQKAVISSVERMRNNGVFITLPWASVAIALTGNPTGAGILIPRPR